MHNLQIQRYKKTLQCVIFVLYIATIDASFYLLSVTCKNMKLRLSAAAEELDGDAPDVVTGGEFYTLGS